MTLVRKASVLFALFLVISGSAFAQQKLESSKLGPVTQRAQSGVNLNNGNFYTSIIDNSFYNEPLPIAITRTYNSRSNYEGFFGFGWSSNIDTYLEFMPDETILLRKGGGGRTEVFAQQAKSKGLTSVVTNLIKKLKGETPGKSQTYWDNIQKQALNDEYYRRTLLRRNFPSDTKYLTGTHWVNLGNPGEWIEKADANNFKYVSPNSPIHTFDKKGNLLEIFDPTSKSKITFQWKNDRMIGITDMTGRSVRFTYTNDGLVSRAVFTGVDKNQVTVAYRYIKQGNIHLLDATRDGYNNVLKYQYTQKGDLSKIAYHDKTAEVITYNKKKDWVERYQKWDGTSTQYTYSVDSSDPLRQSVSVRYLTSDNKPLRSDEKFEYQFKRTRSGSVFLASVRERVGSSVKETHYDERLQLPSLIIKDGSKASMKYDDKGRLIEKRDESGITAYEYVRNSKRPNVVKKNGVVYRYNYDRTLVKSAEGPDGRIAITYNKNNRIQSIANKKTGDLLTFEYNSFGQPRKIQQKNYGEILFHYSNTGQVLKLESNSLRSDVSRVMVANRITQSFQTFLTLMIHAGTKPVLDAGFNLSAALKQKKNKVL